MHGPVEKIYVLPVASQILSEKSRFLFKYLKLYIGVFDHVKSSII